jgi:Ni,Fe-hydrogenase I cytochrome b subunit
MEWMHTFSIIATVIATGYYIHRDVINDMKAQTARTDRLYEMFIDLIKEGKK